MTTATTEVDYRAIIEPTVVDFVTLKGCVQQRDRSLVLEQDKTDKTEDGVHYITVRSRGCHEPLWTILRTEKTWIVHEPADGPAHEFVAPGEVAVFLAMGHAVTAKRSWFKSPWLA